MQTKILRGLKNLKWGVRLVVQRTIVMKTKQTSTNLG